MLELVLRTIDGDWSQQGTLLDGTVIFSLPSQLISRLLFTAHGGAKPLF